MDHAWRLLTLEARREGGPDVDKFMDLALAFYFYWVNFGPLSRGTAACGYLSILALMLSIGYEIQVRLRGFSSRASSEAICLTTPDAQRD